MENQLRTVEGLKESGYDLFVSINGQAHVKVTPAQLSKAVFSVNRRDEVIVNLYRGRNGAKSATIISIPKQ